MKGTGASDSAGRAVSIFRLTSNAIQTKRDDWLFDRDADALSKKADALIQAYEIARSEQDNARTVVKWDAEHTVRRPLIDQLRGALPYHGAIRGTLITLGKFAKGVEDAALFPGAAPITLIDGDRLVEMVEKHQVGLRRKPAYLLEIDEAFFAERNVERDPHEGDPADIDQGD